MPFLQPLIPIIGKGVAMLGGKMALAKAGMSIGGGLLASKLAGGRSTEDQAAFDAQNKNLLQGQQIASDAQGQGSQLTQLAGRSFNPVVDYWSKILSNRGAATSALAPQLNQINEGYQATNQAGSALMSRGGARADFLGQLPYKQMRDQQTLLQTARPQAAAGLLQAGQGAAGAGNSLLSNATSALYGSTSAGRSILDANQQRRDSDRAMGAGIGKSIFELLKGVGGGAGGKTAGILDAYSKAKLPAPGSFGL